jgi:hypothetical protein
MSYSSLFLASCRGNLSHRRLLFTGLSDYGLKDWSTTGSERLWRSRKYAWVDMMNICTCLRPGMVNYWGGDSMVKVNFRDGFDEGIRLIYSSFVT